MRQEFSNQDNEREKTIADGEMSLVDHLQELRQRLIICIVAVAIASSAAYLYAPELVHLVTQPVGKLYYMNPAEAFFAYLKVSVFAGFLVVVPLVLYQVWGFVVPALTQRERKASFILVPASVILFFMGLLFAYFFVLPAGIRFFMGFANEDLQPMFSLGQYLSFVISFLLPFGFIFELPLVILVIAKFGIINSGFLVAKRKLVLVLAFVVGAIIAPTPDIFSQTMIAIPLLVLYEVSILLVKYVLHK
ncbi:MAG: tatC [Firmicutes bacterium]|nr:tatC [Bacillota bacterium]